MSNTNENTNEPGSIERSNVSEASSASRPNLGFCHVCDRQVEIELDSFTCSLCHGGFIELFEGDSANQRNQDSTTNPQPAQVDAARILSDANISSILPMLLPQLLGQATGGNTNIRFGFHSSSQPSSSSQQQQQQPHRHPFGPQNPFFNASTTTQPASNEANAQQGPQRQTTRLQFIVPGEPGGQFDLYGIINNVLSDILDPRRQGSLQQNAQFHFQAPPIRMFQLHGDMRDYAWGTNGLDTIITQLLNQLENTGPPPATDQQLINIPVITISQEEVDKKLECAICMEDFRLGEEAKKLPCKHCFHQPCISEWLKLHGTCPVCRKNLNGEDTSQREYISRAQQPDANTSESTSAHPQSVPTTNTASSTTTTNTQDRSSSTDADAQVYNDMEFD